MNKLIICIMLFLVSTGHAYKMSYLTSESNIAKTVSILKYAGIKQGDIDLWVKYIRSGNCKLSNVMNKGKDGIEIEPKEAAKFFYNSGILPNINCRQSAFMLLRHQLGIVKYLRKYSTSDFIANESGRLKHLIPDYLERDEILYKSAFNYNSIPKSEIMNECYEKALSFYKKWWSKEGFTFPENKNLMVVYGMVVSPLEKWAGADHVGVAVRKDGKLYLIEKQGFGYNVDFAISEFANEGELGAHMSAFLSTWKDEKTSIGIMVMLNDKIIYRE